MRKINKFLGRILIFVMVLTLLPIHANAATARLNKTKATIYVGQTVTLKVTGTKDKIKWSSSRSKVAAVSTKGKVTAKNSGTAKITAIIGKKKLNCSVTVKNPYLNKKKVTLQAGSSIVLKLTGAKAKTWSSSNHRVAIVNKDGKVSAKGSGTAVIKVKAANQKIYSCVVTVTEPVKIPEPTEESHTHKYQAEVTQPTCNRQGYTTYTCECGDTYESDYVDILEHESSDWQVTKEPTCTESGWKEKKCKRCDSFCEGQYIPATGHQYAVLEEAASEDEAYGYAIYECVRCKDHQESYTVDMEVVDKTNNKMSERYFVYPGFEGIVELHSYLPEELQPYLKVDLFFLEQELEQYLTVDSTGYIKVSKEALFDSNTAFYLDFYLDDNPYHAHLMSNVTIPPAGMSAGDDFYKIRQTIVINNKTYAECRNKEETILEEIITEDMMDVEKIRAVHDWICANVVYDWDTYLGNENASITAYDSIGALLYGKAVCSGYARVFKEFMDLLDIPCYYVRSDKLNHAWNQVLVDGKWYWLDCTWDDTDDERVVCYTFFLRGGSRVADQVLDDGTIPPECAQTQMLF